MEKCLENPSYFAFGCGFFGIGFGGLRSIGFGFAGLGRKLRFQLRQTGFQLGELHAGFDEDLLLDVVFFAIFTIIFLQTAQGVYSIGVMVLLIQLVTMARDPVTSMSWLVDTSQRAITGSSEYFSVMDEPDEPNNALEVVPTTDLVHRGGPVIEFDHVSFSYGDTSGPVLEDITLAIRRGERIAFVGESGGGKTTLVNLILKLYPATSGQVRVNGQPVNEIPVAALRREIGVVFQRHHPRQHGLRHRGHR